MGEASGSSSRKRRRDASRSRSRSRKSSSHRRKSGSSRRSRSASRTRTSRSHRTRERSASRSSLSSASSRSRSRSRSRKDKDRKRSSRRGSSASPSRKDKSKKKHRRRSRSRSRSRDRSAPRRRERADSDRRRKGSEEKPRTQDAQPRRNDAVKESKEQATATTGARRDRSRSRSRGRGAENGAKATPSATKTFKFNAISLKGGNKSDPASTDDEKKKRREKLKLWREQQLKQKQEEEKQKLLTSFLAADEAVPKRIKLWSLDTEEAKEETDERRQKREEEEALQREREQRVVEEVDPLDAFMAGLVDEAAIQQSIVNPATNVISLDDIQAGDRVNIYGTFIPPFAETPQTPVPVATSKDQSELAEGALAAAPKESKEEAEAREDRELQEFMLAIREKREQEEKQAAADNGEENPILAAKKAETGRIYQGFEEDVIGEKADDVDHRSALEILQEAQKKKEIQAVDHSQIEYAALQKKFYVVPKEIKSMSEEDVEAIRNDLEIKVRGKNCPRPLDKWTQCGFSVRMLQLIQKHGYVEPFAIQRQALPAIMSGRDVIGIAKTGSGKTLAFLLPMFRHILAQPPLKEGEGPIGMIMAPARELAQQIYVEAKKFAKGLGMRATAVYGGSSVSEQIGNLKRGSDIVICTPGRMIDILSMSAGKMVSLKRVTYVVLDEADRMFDMGFEPQITKIMLNIRPDRQTLLFSATFPKAVETLARKVLKKPVEITVGARSTASGDITQYVEVREENDKFMRLLQLLGLWYERGNILVFVNTQQACDQVFQDLMKAGYPALSLHGGKDQVDRDFTIDDFKRKVRTLMVATSVAGRGLDVKDLVLVINYHCPNHLEDYVHRVGRTGRAGRKGTAYTFISPDEEEYSVDLVKALETAKQDIPQELTNLAEAFKEKVRKGEARYHGSGFKGKGYTFDESEKNEAQRAADLQKRQYELAEGIVIEDADDDDEDEDREDGPPRPVESQAVSEGPSQAPPATENEALSAVRRAQQIAQMLGKQYEKNQSATSDENHFEEELEINDYPQQARWKVTQKEATERVAELTGAAVITRGSFVPTGRKPNPGERKLYLAIEGPSRAAVLEAKRELQRVLDETTLQVGLGGDRYGKYNL